MQNTVEKPLAQPLPQSVTPPQPAPKQDQPQDATPDMRILFNAFRL